MALTVRLDSCDGERARGLQNRARVLERVLDCRADRVGVDPYHLVDELAADAKRFLADLLDRDPVRK